MRTMNVGNRAFAVQTGLMFSRRIQQSEV